MKNKQTLYILTIAIALSAGACNNADTEKAKDMADSAAAKMDTAVQDVKRGAENAAGEVRNALSSNEDSNFVVKAALTNNAELRILQAGIDNGTNKELKAHARMMLSDHKKLGGKVKSYSSGKGYILPDNDKGKADDELAKLNEKKKGSEWDKEWVDHMVSAHGDAISMFENGRDKVKDNDLKTIISDALPTLHSHLDMMKQLQDNMGK